jgi:hypothetical protein
MQAAAAELAAVQQQAQQAADALELRHDELLKIHGIEQAAAEERLQQVRMLMQKMCSR